MARRLGRILDPCGGRAMLMRLLAVTEIALLVAACTSTGPPNPEAQTRAQSEGMSRPEIIQQVGGGGGGGM